MMSTRRFLSDAFWFLGQSALLVAVAHLACGTVLAGGNSSDANASVDCASSATGPAVQLPTAKLIIEHNSTDADTGVHGAFDGVDWLELCVFDPNGRQILGVRPQGQLKDLSMSGIFFESREPPNEAISIADILAQFPEGMYSIGGTTLQGRRMKGAAIFTHDIPAEPIVIFPQDGAVVDPSSLVIRWDPVGLTLTGAPLKTTGYEVIITKLVADDPNGFSRPTFDVHLPPSRTQLSIPSEFLEPRTSYELEVLALEESGNQTITVSFFKTQ